MALRKTHRLAALLPLFGLAALRCDGDGTAPLGTVTPVATIEVFPAVVTLDSAGDVDTLTAVARDGEGNVLSNLTLSWSSSDTAVVAVEEGVVTGMGAGTATVRASAEDVTSNPVAVTVTAPPAAFTCTQVIGFSQTNDWYSRGFESLVADDAWQELWRIGAAIDLWADPDYAGWSEPIVSPCVTNSDDPDRVLLTISGGFNDDASWWAGQILVVVSHIRDKYPNVREIMLQPVVGGPNHQVCSPNGERASTNHPVIDAAIALEAGGDVTPGFSPEVRTCADYSDFVGHLFTQASEAVAVTIGQYYASR